MLTSDRNGIRLLRTHYHLQLLVYDALAENTLWLRELHGKREGR